jgi:hypothetical protein
LVDFNLIGLIELRVVFSFFFFFFEVEVGGEHSKVDLALIDASL